MALIAAAMHRMIQDSRKLWLFSGKETAAKLFEEHRMLFEANRDGDPKAAAATMTKHLTQVENALQSAK